MLFSACGNLWFVRGCYRSTKHLFWPAALGGKPYRAAIS